MRKALLLHKIRNNSACLMYGGMFNSIPRFLVIYPYRGFIYTLAVAIRADQRSFIKHPLLIFYYCYIYSQKNEVESFDSYFASASQKPQKIETKPADPKKKDSKVLEKSEKQLDLTNAQKSAKKNNPKSQKPKKKPSSSYSAVSSMISESFSYPVTFFTKLLSLPMKNSSR